MHGTKQVACTVSNCVTVSELITPAMAAKYLEANKCNRPLSPVHVDMLCREMRDGKFYHTHQGIAFDSTGTLIDGQHRLVAIVKAQTPQVMQVTRGLLSAAMGAIDLQQRPRSVSDALQITGNDLATQKAVALVRMLSILRGGPRKMTVHEIGDFISDHEDAIRFAVEQSSSYAMTSVAPVAAMLAIAHEAGHGEKIREWVNIVGTGIGKEAWHTSAIRLRDWMMTNKAKSHSSEGRIELCRKVSASMVAFVEERSLDRIYASQEIKWLFRSDA